MKARRIDGIYLLLLGTLIFWALGLLFRQGGNWMEDFKGVYYSTRSLALHGDPYNPRDVLSAYLSERQTAVDDPVLGGQRQAVTLCVYPPATFLLAFPFTLLGWQVGQLLWYCLIAASFPLASYAAWSLGAEYAPVLSGGLICFMLINGFGILLSGNAAGIVVNLCIIAMACFLRQRFAFVGVLCLGVSIVVKPHDAMLFWLFLLLTGGMNRRRAVQALSVCVLLIAVGVLWVSSVAPDWTHEYRANLALASGALGRDNPGPSSLSTPTSGMIIDLQTIFSIFRDDPVFYNTTAYILGGTLALAWSFVTVRASLSPSTALLALAALAPLSLLPIYHRTYDAKILLLSIPACAMLWAEPGFTRWLALATTSAGIALTGDFPLVFLLELSKRLRTPKGIEGKMLATLFTRPAPLALLAMAIFYLWLYFQRTGWRKRENADAEAQLQVHLSS